MGSPFPVLYTRWFFVFLGKLILMSGSVAIDWAMGSITRLVIIIMSLLSCLCQSVGLCSQVQQQWRLGVMCFAASHGPLSTTTSSITRQHNTTFALLMLQSSGCVPAQVSIYQLYLDIFVWIVNTIMNLFLKLLTLCGNLNIFVWLYCRYDSWIV